MNSFSECHILSIVVNSLNLVKSFGTIAYCICDFLHVFLDIFAKDVYAMNKFKQQNMNRLKWAGVVERENGRCSDKLPLKMPRRG